MTRSVYLCSCNRTMPFDAAAQDRAATAARLDTAQVHRFDAMCQHELERFAGTLDGDAVIGCTQEAKLLAEVAADVPRVSTIRFFNPRETAGWSSEARDATPKLAALLAQAVLPEPEPTTQVSLNSRGHTLVIGPLADALSMADALRGVVDVSVLATDRPHAQDVSLPRTREFAVFTGSQVEVLGWLGAFAVHWRQSNPIDLDACIRCGACVEACPEGAISASLQVDSAICRAHRDCVVACGSVGAIDFARAEAAREAQFDIVLNLGDQTLFNQHQPPQGYLAPGRDMSQRLKAVGEIAALTGEFEKPRFVQYRANLCAHSRNRKTGCTQCIDVCSTRAIHPEGERVVVSPQLCMGCGACTTVCPSGALSYQLPRTNDLGAQLRTLLQTFAAAGGRDATLLLHDSTEGAAAIATLARDGDGLPARCLPLALHHPAAAGLDIWLSAFAYGATGVTVLTTASTAPEYRLTLASQADMANTILAALGYQGAAVRIIDERDLALSDWAASRGLGVRSAATHHVGNDKRAAVDAAAQHLLAHAPTPQTLIALGEGAPFGEIAVDADRCTMCLACVGSCPEGALSDNAEVLQLRFIEAKCVQCGLCAKTCPEKAIQLTPRLNLDAGARRPRVLNQAELAQCTRCGKSLGPRKLLDNMRARLSSHSMFADDKARARLMMCGDCRVVDLYSEEKPLDIREQR